MRRRKTCFVELVILALALAIPPLAVEAGQKLRSRRNHAPDIQSFATSEDVINHCPFEGSDVCGGNRIVTLEVKASDRDGDSLSYKYSVSAGKIAGTGSTVNWDLTDSRLGNHTAVVEVTDQRGGTSSRTATVAIVACSSCDPPCPTLAVTCPASVAVGETVVFEAMVLGEGLRYLWSDMSGKLIVGETGPTLRITATGSPGDLIRGTVEVIGLSPACNRQASCESKLEKRQ